MKKYIIGSLAALTLFVGVAQAQTVDNTELINRLLKQLAELTAMVQRLQAQQTITESTPSKVYIIDVNGNYLQTGQTYRVGWKVGNEVDIHQNVGVGLQTVDGTGLNVKNIMKNYTPFFYHLGSYTGEGADKISITIPSNIPAGTYTIGLYKADSKAFNFGMSKDTLIKGSETRITVGSTNTNNGAFSASARFVENSQDKVGIWDVFKAGKGNASSITADWAWDVTFYNNTDKLRHIKKISVLHEPTGEGWSTDYERMYNRANGYPLLVVSPEGKTLETKYVGDIDIEIDAKSQKTFRLYGQPEGRTYKEATVWIYFADGSATSVRAGRSGMVESPIIVISDGLVLRIETARRVNDRSVTVLPNGEESLFAVGVDTNKSVYANTLEVRFKKVSGSGNFEDYMDKVSLVDRFNRPISHEGGVTYDGDTTIYKFTKLVHRVTDREDFYVKIKAKKDMDKAGKFTMMVPKDGLQIGDGSYVSGVITNTITFDPTYTLKKNETTVEQSYVRLTLPNNGGTFNNEETIEIRYTTNLDYTNSEGVTLQLYRTTKDRAAIWQPVLTIATKLKNGKYLWQIPKDLPEGEYNIFAVGQGVYAQGSSIADFTDKPITIKKPAGMGI